jgi:hypothetical protein
MQLLKNSLHTCERICFSTLGACSYHSYRRVSCCNSHSWETSCRCGPVQSSCTEKTFVSTLRVHVGTTATAGFPVATVTVGKPLADAGPSNHPVQGTHLFLHSGCMQLPQLPYHRVSCCNSHSWETSCRCGPVQSSWTEKTLFSTLRVHAVTTATAVFPVAIITVRKPLADAGPSNHPVQGKHLFLHSGCMQLPQLPSVPQSFLLQ